MDIMNYVKEHKILIGVAGVGGLLLLYVVSSSGGGSTQASTGSGDIGPNEASLAGAQLQAQAQSEQIAATSAGQQQLAETQAGYGLELASIQANAQTTQDNTSAAVAVDQISAQANTNQQSIAASLAATMAQVQLGADQITANLTGLESNNATTLGIASLSAQEQEDIANVTAQTQIGLGNLSAQTTIANINAMENVGITQSNNALAASQTNAIVGGITSLFSDDNMKTDIKLVGWENGFNVYHYRYHGSRKVNRGVMASEVLKKCPQAVTNLAGMLMVNYDMIGVTPGIVG